MLPLEHTDVELTKDKKAKENKEGCIGCLIMLVIILLAGNWLFNSCSLPKPAETTQQATQSQSQPAPAPQPAASKSLGVSREQIMFTLAAVKVPFKSLGEEKVNGQNRAIAEAETGTARIEMIGPPENITRISLVFGVVKGELGTASSGMLAMYGIMQPIFPNWSDCNKWITEAIIAVGERNQPSVTTQRDGKEINFYPDKNNGLFWLTIQPI